MPLIQTVTVGNRVIDLLSFTGEVVDEKKWATTQVSGGGSTTQATGYASNAPITSTTTTHDQFFLRSDDGQEMAVELANAGLALRKGHRVSVLWGIVKGNERGPYLAVYNHTTGDLNRFESGVSGLAVPPRPTAILIAYIASVFAICLYGLGFIALIALFIYRLSQKNKLVAAFRPSVEAAIAQIKSQK